MLDGPAAPRLMLGEDVQSLRRDLKSSFLLNAWQAGKSSVTPIRSETDLLKEQFADFNPLFSLFAVFVGQEPSANRKGNTPPHAVLRLFHHLDDLLRSRLHRHGASDTPQRATRRWGGRVTSAHWLGPFGSARSLMAVGNNTRITKGCK